MSTHLTLFQENVEIKAELVMHAFQLATEKKHASEF
jgi:hypothetical protein